MNEQKMSKYFLICQSIFFIVQISVGQSINYNFNSPGLGYNNLFNGKDFSGWDIEPDKGRWIVGDGIINCLGKPQVPYMIYSDKEYENFDLFVEFKMDDIGNSGVLVHLPEKGSGRESRLGCEIQIEYHKTDMLHTTGSLYDLSPALFTSENTLGQWNQFHINFDWPVCKVWLNGDLIQDFDFSTNDYSRFRLRKGPIGLQNHGDPVQFRNIWIKELSPKEKWTSLIGTDLSEWQQIGKTKWRVEDGQLVANGGEGFLVSKKEFSDYEIFAYVSHKEDEVRNGGFYYRWTDSENPGYFADFFDVKTTRNIRERLGNKSPEWIKGIPFPYPWLPYQFISTEEFTQVRLGGAMVQQNSISEKTGKKIAIYHAKGDGELRIKDFKIKKLDWQDISTMN